MGAALNTLAQLTRDLVAAPGRWLEEIRQRRRARQLRAQIDLLLISEVEYRHQLVHLTVVRHTHADARVRQQAEWLMPEVERQIGRLNTERRALRRQIVGLELV